MKIENMTADQIEMNRIRKERADAKKAAQKLALDKLLALALSSADPEAVALAKSMQAPEKITRTVIIAGKPRATVADFIRDVFADGDVQHEDLVWSKFKLGRYEMKAKCLDALKRSKDAADRPWVTFSPVTGEYTLSAWGEKPEGFDGFIPDSMKTGVIAAVDTEVKA